MSLYLYAATIFCGAFLLFLVQPMASKHILPWFGGSAAVWAVCLSFFQVVLLAGYAYAHWVHRRLAPLTQVVLHVVLLAAAWASLQVLADVSWKPGPHDDPTLRILGMLAASIGLPYLLLSSTGPLVQSWVAQAQVDARVYRLFSLGNLASLLGLLAYPFVLEPRFTLSQQADAWQAVYTVYSLLCLGCGLLYVRSMRTVRVVWQAPKPPNLAQRYWRKTRPPAEFVNTEPSSFGELVERASRHAQQAQGRPPRGPQASGKAPGLGARLRWIAWSALGSWLLVATTNHLTRDVAAIPFLWILPLVLYLFSFVVCFESDRWYQRGWVLPLVLLATGASSAVLWAGVPIGPPIPVAIGLFGAAVFLQCVFLHGELARERPAPEFLTGFYLMLSVGGAVGGALVSLAAPRLLPAYYELGAGYVLLALATIVAWRRVPLAVLLGLAALAWCAACLAWQIRDDLADSRTMLRNFYGTLATSDHDAHQPLAAYRLLRHGSVIHGEQYLAPTRRLEPTTYYGVTSGLGRAILATRREGQRIGVIGLGAGTTAAYGKSGDMHRYYEINPQVVEIAQREFTFLSAGKAQSDTVLGDARLVLEAQAPQGFDVLAVDAFSGDSVPVHLLTREALAVYLRHVRPDGVVAFHVTNRHLNLAPVVRQLAQDARVLSVLIHDSAEDSSLRRTDWVLVTRSARVLSHTEILEAATPFPTIPGLPVWTDAYSNLFQILK